MMPGKTIAKWIRRGTAAFILLIALPLGAQAVVHLQKDGPGSWHEADWSSTGQLPDPRASKPAMVRIYAARTGRWKGIFAVHTWIVLKERNAAAYQRFDKVGWGSPVRRDIRAPDGRWYSNVPVAIFTATGTKAERLIPKIKAAIRAYPFRRYGDYRVWPGPNSNTFVACVLARVPEIEAALPPTAVGKDYPCSDRWFGPSPSRTGFRLNLAGYAGITLGWIEGLELNILGAVAGIDVRRPALKLPGFGRIGMAASHIDGRFDGSI